MNVHAVRVAGLVKRFGEVTALDGLDLEVARGSVLGVLGPNGAGKTTLVRLLATLTSADAGTAEVAGFDVVDDAEQVRARLGLTGQFAAVDEVLTARENLVWFARLRGLDASAAKNRAGELLAAIGLGDAADARVGTFSGGMRRRLDIAVSLVVEPEVLVLDEPTTGLDPRSRLELWAVIRGLRSRGVTVLLTTQYLEEADQLADRIVVVDRGRVIADGTAEQLKAQVGGARVSVVASDGADLDVIASVVSGAAGGTAVVDVEARRVTVPVTDGVAALTAVALAIKEQGLIIDDIGVQRPTLDDVFLTLTGHRTPTGHHEAVGEDGHRVEGEVA